MGQAICGDPSSAGYTFNGAEDAGFADMDRVLLLSHPPRATCELQGSDSPGFGMGKCQGLTHPVLCSSPPQLARVVAAAWLQGTTSHSHHFLSLYLLSFLHTCARSLPVLCCPDFAASALESRASCDLLCQMEHVLPGWVCRPREHVGLQGWNPSGTECCPE